MIARNTESATRATMSAMKYATVSATAIDTTAISLERPERRERIERSERSERSLFGGSDDWNLQLNTPAVAKHVHGRRGANCRVLDHPLQRAAVGHGVSVEGDDDVSGPQPRGERRRVAAHALHQHASCVRRPQFVGRLRRQRCEFDVADVAPADLAVLEEVVDHSPREIAGDGEPDALVDGDLAEDGRVDADELA